VRRDGITAADLFAALYHVDGGALDLSGVRIHHSGVDDLCYAWGALAFTIGSDICIRSDCYAPQTPAGLWLLAHEVAHVAQQRFSSVGVAGSPRPGLTRPGEGPSAADRFQWPSAVRPPTGPPTALVGGPIMIGPPNGPAEREADAAADAVLAGRPFVFVPGIRRWGLQRYMAWEHLLLGHLDPADLQAAIAGPGRLNGKTASGSLDHLEAQCALLDELGRDPGLSQERLQAEHPNLQTVRLSGSGLVVTLGELNILPDYLSHPAQIDAATGSYITTLVQAVRAMTYRELRRLMGQSGPPRLPWSPLRYPNRRVFSEIREAIEVDALGRKCARPAWELYSSVVGRNASHFAPFSWYRWQAFHLQARDLIRRSAAVSGEERANLRRTAQIYAGYADHFLQDSFAAGHLINKTLIMQWYVEWLLKSRLPLADRTLLAPMTCQHQPMLHGPDLYYPEPGQDGQRLYPRGNTDPLAVTDPQTAIEGATLEERIRASGITGATPEDRQTGYVRYLALLGSGVAQISAAIVHARFNKSSLVAASRGSDPRYPLWGDRSLFAGEDGAVQAATAAHASRQAIADLLETGHTDIKSRQIFERFPCQVEVDGALLPLPEWHETSLRRMCFDDLFGLGSTQAKRLLITLTARRLGVPAEDYQQLRELVSAGRAMSGR
jgi:hypothetical protein